MSLTRVSGDLAPFLRKEPGAVEHFQSHDHHEKLLSDAMITIKDDYKIYQEIEQMTDQKSKLWMTVYDGQGNVVARMESKGEADVMPGPSTPVETSPAAWPEALKTPEEKEQEKPWHQKTWEKWKK